MHGTRVEIGLNGPDFRASQAVTFLHLGRAGVRTCDGFGITEAIAAVTLFAVGVLGAVALGSGAWRMTQIAALRSAQAQAAAQALDGGWGTPRADLVLEADTVDFAAGLVEVRVTVGGGAGPGSAMTWITRRLETDQ